MKSNSCVKYKLYSFRYICFIFGKNSTMINHLIKS